MPMHTPSQKSKTQIWKHTEFQYALRVTTQQVYHVDKITTPRRRRRRRRRQAAEAVAAAAVATAAAESSRK